MIEGVNDRLENVQAGPADEAMLDELLTQPRACLVDFIKSVSSPLLLLGAGGKMGPSLAVLAKRAAKLAGHPLKVIAVSRFSNESAQQWLESRDVSTICANLLDRDALRNLPDAADVIYLAGQKFGTRNTPSATWALNTLAPAYAAERYAQSRIVALSTGNVYPFVPTNGGGAIESTPLTPTGEYANAAVARERIFEHFALQNKTRLSILRLSYAVELRYGVLADIACKVRDGEPIDLTSDSFNCIWQGDANEIILRALGTASNPPAIFNLSGPDTSRVRQVAETFSKLLNRPARFTGMESGTALLSNMEKLHQTFGQASTPLENAIRWTASWVSRGGKSLNKPTHFEVRDGNY